MTPKVLITGANGAIGSAIAKALAATGARLALLDVSDRPDPSLDAMILSGEASYHRIDITDDRSVREAFGASVEAMGGANQLINAAGIVSLGSIGAISIEEWQRVLSVNLTGVFLCCQAILPEIANSGTVGRIINIGSVVAKNGGNARPWLDVSEQEKSANAAYGAAKAGVHALTKFLAKELASTGATANCVAPGPVATAMTTTFPRALQKTIPLGRMGTAEEIASLVVYLGSPQASFISGEIIDVNGAMWCD